MAAPAEDGFHISLFARRFLGLLHIIPDPGEALEIGLDVIARLLARDRQLVGEAEGRDAIDDAEIDRLGAPAHFRRHALDRHVEHLRRRNGVDVCAVGEGLLELRDLGDMRKHAQFDLAIVGRDQLVALFGDEGGPDLAAFGRAHRDVLQVGIGRRQASCRGRRERI